MCIGRTIRRTRQPTDQHAEIVLERQVVSFAIRGAGDGEIDRALGLRWQNARRVADGLVVELVADAHAKAPWQVANLPVGLVPQEDVEDQRVLRLEPEHLLQADFEVIEIGDWRVVAERPGRGVGNCFGLLRFKQRKCLGLVQQTEQPRRAEMRRQGNGLHRGRGYQVERQDRGCALHQLEDIRAVVPADVEVGVGLRGQRPN